MTAQSQRFFRLLSDYLSEKGSEMFQIPSILQNVLVYQMLIV